MELHDNLGQRVSLLAAELGVLRQQLANGADTPELAISIAVRTVACLAAHTAEIGEELQRIANAGRRMPMDAAELTAALDRLCHDMSRVFRIAIHLDWVKIILFTASDDRSVRSTAMALGASAFVVTCRAAFDLLPAIENALADEEHAPSCALGGHAVTQTSSVSDWPQ